jgi:hypothetical protein
MSLATLRAASVLEGGLSLPSVIKSGQSTGHIVWEYTESNTGSSSLRKNRGPLTASQATSLLRHIAQGQSNATDSTQRWLIRATVAAFSNSDFKKYGVSAVIMGSIRFGVNINKDQPANTLRRDLFERWGDLDNNDLTGAQRGFAIFAMDWNKIPIDSWTTIRKDDDGYYGELDIHSEQHDWSPYHVSRWLYWVANAPDAWNEMDFNYTNETITRDTDWEKTMYAMCFITPEKPTDWENNAFSTAIPSMTMQWDIYT